MPLLLLLAGLGCDGSRPTEPDSPREARYLFEVELENHDPRFPPYWLGIVVEADGSVYEYDRTGVQPRLCDHYWQWAIADECRGRTLSEAQLTQRYSPGRSLLTRVSPEELATRIEQSGRVADGPFRIPNMACNDFGVLSLVAFDFDRGRYGALVLRLEGDQIRQNLSTAALDLAPWLLELAERKPFIRQWRRGAADCRPD